MKYQIFAPIRSLMKKQHYSEREVSKALGLSRTALRRVLLGNENVTLKSIAKLAQFLGKQAWVLFTNADGLSEYSCMAVAIKIKYDGFNSWKIHLMDFVDEFRRTLDPLLVIQRPPKTGDPRTDALLASTVLCLCDEFQLLSPEWAKESYFLQKPWFLSDMESLKTFALIESHWAFRNNNIFVQSNFLQRA